MFKKRIDKTNFKFKESILTEEILKKLKDNGTVNDYFFDNDFCLLNGDCIEVMNQLISEGILVNHIITDIPYGTVQGLCIEGWKNSFNIPHWDVVIEKDKMFDMCFKISKPNANLLLFSQEPLTHQLIFSMQKYEKYSLSNKMVWIKNNHANGFNAKRTPLNYYEEILLIRKSLDESNNLDLRKYFKDLLEWIPDTKKEIINKLGQGLDHCFRYQNRTFYIPTLENYNKLITEYKINNFKKFIDYEVIKEKWKKENEIIFNQDDNSKIVKNVLEYKKDKINIHPTQKPIELLKFLIKTFSNENDLILDFTCGSGSTGIAATQLNRKFIGIELDKKFFQKSINWYKKNKEI